jgi:invasion protein IalB
MLSMGCSVLLVSLVFSPNSFAQSSTSEASVPANTIYVSDTFKDWQKLCVQSTEGIERCHIYHLIKDGNDHPTAEMALFRVFDEEGISAAATILTPLETLLTSDLKFSVDNSEAVVYPFSWCNKRGCHVRVAFTDDDILSMKKGHAGKLEIESITAPGETIVLKVSLSGFTMAFASLQQ